MESSFLYFLHPWLNLVIILADQDHRVFITRRQMEQPDAENAGRVLFNSPLKLIAIFLLLKSQRFASNVTNSIT
jgi:hypothetical protein